VGLGILEIKSAKRRFGRKITGLFTQQKFSILLPICVVINIGNHDDDNNYSFRNHDQTEHVAKSALEILSSIRGGGTNAILMALVKLISILFAHKKPTKINLTFGELDSCELGVFRS